jgi:hypothetical protein
LGEIRGLGAEKVADESGYYNGWNIVKIAAFEETASGVEEGVTAKGWASDGRAQLKPRSNTRF